MSLEDELTAALWHTVDVARDHRYTPTFFMQMLHDYNGLGTAQRLLANKEAQTGLIRLYEENLLDYSMEAVVLQKRFQSLFTAKELAEAHRRLEDLNYNFPNL